MKRRPFQYGLSTLMGCVAFAAFNFWLCSLGAWGVVLAIVIGKHVLVAHVCWRLEVDRRGRPSSRASELKQAA